MLEADRLAVLEFDLDLAGDDEIDGIGASLRGARPPRPSAPCAIEQLHDFRDALAPRSAKTGTFATMLQVTTNSRRWITSANEVAMMPTGSASSAKPIIAVMPGENLADGVIGTTSP